MLNGNKLKNKPTLKFENKAREEGFSIIIGVDEAGRGPLAGPVVAAAVVLREISFRARIADSKLITPQQREAAFHEILDKSYVGVGIISEMVIDRVNILESTYLAMTNAVNHLLGKLPQAQMSLCFPDGVCLLIDGDRFKSDLPIQVRTIVDGDRLVLSIACASIVAKVVRDRILSCYDRIFPEYGFGQHKGYPTPEHKAALRTHGFSPFIESRSVFKR